MKYRVLVDDNFNYMDKSERFSSGEYDTEGEALDAARKIVDAFLESSQEHFSTAEDLLEHYRAFAEDPFITTESGSVDFSAWEYARSRCHEIYSEIAKQILQGFHDDKYFPFRDDEYWIIEETIKSLRQIIAIEAENPAKPSSLAMIMFAVQRLPFAVSGFNSELSIVYRSNDESAWCALEISSDRLAYTEGGNSYDPDIGSDSRSTTLLEMETSGFRDCEVGILSPIGWFESVAELLEMGAEVEVCDMGALQSIDLDHNPINPWNEYLRILESGDRSSRIED